MTAPDPAEAGGHSPLPWTNVKDEGLWMITSATGHPVVFYGDFEKPADAEFVLATLNAYEALVAERDRLREALRPFATMPETWVLVAYEQGAQKHVFHDEVALARATLSPPTGTEPAR